MATADPTYMRIYMNKSKELKSLMTSDIKGAQPKRTTWERRENSDPWSGIPTYLSNSMGPVMENQSLPRISLNKSQTNNNREDNGMNNVRPGAKNLDHLSRMMMNLPGSYQRLHEMLKNESRVSRGAYANQQIQENLPQTYNDAPPQMAGHQTQGKGLASPYKDAKSSNSDMRLPALGRQQPGASRDSSEQKKPLLPHLQTSESLLAQGHLSSSKGFTIDPKTRYGMMKQPFQERQSVQPPRYYLDGIYIKQGQAKPAGVVIDPEVQELRFFGGRKGRPLYANSPPPQHDRKPLLDHYESAGLDLEPMSTKGQRYRRVSPDSQFIYQERAPQHVFDRVINTRVMSASKNIEEMRKTAIKEWEQFTQEKRGPAVQ